jgi:hypothetical protein
VNETIVKQDLLTNFSETVGQMSQDLVDWIPILRRLGEIEDLRTLALGQTSEITCASVRSIIAVRRLRDDHFWPAMHDAAWAALLEIFASSLEGERLDVDGLSAATGLQLGATLHWVDWLAGRGMILHKAQVAEGETPRIDLTDSGADKMRAYLLEAINLSPWVQ